MRLARLDFLSEFSSPPDDEIALKWPLGGDSELPLSRLERRLPTDVGLVTLGELFCVEGGREEERA